MAWSTSQSRSSEYGTVGSAVDRLLAENADEIERATGHLRVVRALVRDGGRSGRTRRPDGVLTTDFAAVRDDQIAVVAEVMGGIEPRASTCWNCSLRQAGRDGEQAARRPARRRALLRRLEAGVSCFEASVCAAIPVIKVLRDARRLERPPRARDRQRDDELHPHRDGGGGELRGRARGGAAARVRRGRSDRRRVRRGCRSEDGDPRDRGVRLARHLRRVAHEGDRAPRAGARRRRGRDGRRGPARRLRRSSTAPRRTRPAHARRSPPPLAAVEGAFNAVMLQGDAIREITLEGPGAGGMETASAVVADMVSVSGRPGRASSRTTPAGASWSRCLAAICRPVLRPSRWTTGRACSRASRAAGNARDLGRAARAASDERLRCPPHPHARGPVRTRRRGALEEIAAPLPETRGAPSALAVVSDRGCAGARVKGVSVEEAPAVTLGEGRRRSSRRRACRPSASTSGSSGRARTRPAASRTAA